VPTAVHPAPVGGATHLRGHLVDREVERAHLVIGGRLGADHRALGEGGQLDVHGFVVLARVGFAVDLDVHPDDPVIVFLQLRQLLTHVLPEPVRDLAVTTGDHNFHPEPPVANVWLCEGRPTSTSGRGPHGGGEAWSPPGRPGLRPHNRLQRLSQLECHY
jgi:hypothetical protein